MTKITCTDINMFKSSFEAINKIVTEIRMEVDNDGVRVDAIDPLHTTFVHLEIDVQEFESYDCDKPRSINFTTDEFLKYLKRMNKNTELELIIDDHYLTIKGTSNTTKTYKLKLIELDNTIPTLPELDYPMTVDLTTKTFKEICNDITEFSDRLKIYNKENIIHFDAYGAYVDTELEYSYRNDEQETYTSIYDMEKLGNMLKADKFAQKTRLSFGNNMPILVEMKSQNEKQNLSFILAPRIEEDV